MTRARYLLFVTSRGRTRQFVEDCLRAYAEDLHGPDHEVVVVRVEDHPELADEHRVLSTPLILRELPLPQVRIVGVPDGPDVLARVLDPVLDPVRPSTRPPHHHPHAPGPSQAGEDA